MRGDADEDSRLARLAKEIKFCEWFARVQGIPGLVPPPGSQAHGATPGAAAAGKPKAPDSRPGSAASSQAGAGVRPASARRGSTASGLSSTWGQPRR